MKVGLLTHHWVYNFGANLQVFSTICNIRKLGHEPFVINYRPPKMVEKYDKLVPFEQAEVHRKFQHDHLPLTDVCINSDDIVSVAKKYEFDIVISGSDAVLRLNKNSNREDLMFPNPFWLHWVKEVGVLRTGFLAPSCMGSNYFQMSKTEKNHIKSTLETIDVLTVRDRWTKLMLRFCSYYDRILLCPDPVMALPDVLTSYDVSQPEQSNPDEKYILLSVYQDSVSDQWVDAFVAAAHEANFKVYSLPMPEEKVDRKVDKIIDLPLDPLQWYAWIKHSSGYVGVRFHPIVCCLVNSVPFVSLDHYETRPQFPTIVRRGLRLFYNFPRITSKTFDLCLTTNKKKYCLNRIMWEHHGGKGTFDLLSQGFDSQESQRSIEKVCFRFMQVLQDILTL